MFSARVVLVPEDTCQEKYQHRWAVPEDYIEPESGVAFFIIDAEDWDDAIDDEEDMYFGQNLRSGHYSSKHLYIGETDYYIVGISKDPSEIGVMRLLANCLENMDRDRSKLAILYAISAMLNFTNGYQGFAAFMQSTCTRQGVPYVQGNWNELKRGSDFVTQSLSNLFNRDTHPYLYVENPESASKPALEAGIAASISHYALAYADPKTRRHEGVAWLELGNEILQFLAPQTLQRIALDVLPHVFEFAELLQPLCIAIGCNGNEDCYMGEGRRLCADDYPDDEDDFQDNEDDFKKSADKSTHCFLCPPFK